MPWTPAEPVIEARTIGENLLAFIETNQADALAWATGGTALKPLARIENTAMTNAVVYPAIAETDYTGLNDPSETYNRGTSSVTFDIWVTGAAASTVKTQARYYAKAVKSMIRNCPNGTVFANTNAVANTSVLLLIEDTFPGVEIHENGTSYLQRVQIRASYQLEGVD